MAYFILNKVNRKFDAESFGTAAWKNEKVNEIGSFYARAPLNVLKLLQYSYEVKAITADIYKLCLDTVSFYSLDYCNMPLQDKINFH